SLSLSLSFSLSLSEYSVRLVDGTTSCSGTVEAFNEGEWSGVCFSWWRMMGEIKFVCRKLDCGNPVSESGGPLTEDGRIGVTLFGCSGDESSIRQCDRGGRRGFCNGGYYHHVTCSGKRLSVRLVDGAGLCSGRVEVKSYQSWASVCEADFDRQDAEVVCGELGCGAPAALQGGLYGEGEGQTWDKEFQCKGKESLLLDCDTSDRENNTCLPGNAVGLTCSEPDDVRLVGGGSRCAGGVERYDQGEWRIVGSTSGLKAVAAVVCRQLGCGSTVSELLGNTTRGIRVSCSGFESSLRECSRSYYLRPGLTVICSAELSPDDVRLVGGGSRCAGGVEWYDQGEWRIVGSFSDVKAVAAVVCRQLGCGSTVSVLSGYTTKGFRVHCSGSERALRECSRILTVSSTKLIECSTNSFSPESVRLVDGSGLCSGRVEVKSYQSWASVCEADFDRQDAEVVCRDVGCGAPAVLQGGLYGEGGGQTWDKEFQCKGKESLLLDCDTSDRENNTCLPGNAVGLTCSGKKQFVTQSTFEKIVRLLSLSFLFSEPDDVRLVGGGSRCAGGVEWYDQGEWRIVGTYDWDDVAAVVCRQLGCGSTVSVLPGNTTRGFAVYCDGDESALRECRRTYDLLPGLTVICSGNNNMSYFSLISTYVVSVTVAEDSVRLVNGTTSCSGTVEVFNEGEWLGLCTSWWSMMKEVRFVCRELDCGNPVAESGMPLLEDGKRRVILGGCYGNESSVRQCDIVRGGPGGCNGRTYHHVTCSESVRLVGGAGLCSGRVEVKSNQSWASVCEADFDRQDAEVVCGELGCGAPAALQGGLYGEGEGQTWDKEFQCKGKESLLLDCDTSDRENNTCLPGNAVGLTCSESVRLVDGAGLCSGRVEVKSNQSWASVCEADFDQQDAEVVCGEFGCGAPAALQGGLYGEGGGQTWDKEFQCKGNESLLLDCDTSDRKHNTCLPGNAVGLTCSGKKQFVTQSTLFLTWSEEYERQYRCVLRDVAAVVCRQLGCGSTVSVPPGNTTRGKNIICSGSEPSLRDCYRMYDLLPGLTVICSGNNNRL
uniref:SRCR domain-containing protein n=1 Tax=Oncorhynchus kisutch TaxID=8019 RepID=A0A8C7HH75_ONCKI